ncbi:MAG: hypothetical protein ACE14M_13770 [Terriglobales bacterium]
MEAPIPNDPTPASAPPYGHAQRTGISPYGAMNAILKGEPPLPATHDFGKALERQLRRTERQYVLTHVLHALAWFASLLVLEGD